MSPLLNYLLIPLFVAVFLALNMGGSGTSPSFSAAYGANIIRRSLIPGLFGIMVFAGAILAGKATATTIGKDIIDPLLMNHYLVSIILFSVAISLLLANLLGIPQSTSQSTVLSLSGAAVYFKVLNTQKLFIEIIPAWFITPIISFIICYLIGKYIYKPIRRRGYFTYGNISGHPVIKAFIIVMALYVSFSIGANNVANASGPIASMVLNELKIKPTGDSFILVMLLSTFIVAPGFGIGSSIFGKKILENTGKGIVLFGPVEAIIISFVTATILLIVSVTRGIPASLVQLNTAGIIGIGVAKLGYRNIFRKTKVNKFFLVWLIAPLIAFLMSFLLTFVFHHKGLIPAV
ncbi:MAG: inorganic phosphate transporter [Bacteroidales bacterium]|nr:inorganic phosphate transporter [Bacteroidales bacterium]